jgi:hypothetical protein
MKSKLLIAFVCMNFLITEAQVGIGTTLPEAGLDITSSTSGLLIPRVTLTSLVIEAPVLNPQGVGIPISTLIFHDGSNGITAGYYYWDGAKWVMLTTGGSGDWSILGNSGTNPTTNFIGTTDAQDFVVRTNNTEKARVTSAGDLGIGIVPTTKLHVNQTSNIDAILVNQTGSAGNSLELVPNNAANMSSAIFIVNGTSGAGINNVMSNTASTASSIISNNQGLGVGLDVLQNNTGASQPALQIIQNGTGNFSRGVDMYLDAANIAVGYTLFHAGTGSGMYMDLSNATNNSTGYDLRHAGTGRGLYVDLSEATNASTGSALYHAGTGRASFMSLTNAANASTGAALYHAGTGSGEEVGILNTTNSSMIQSLFHDGLGRGQQIVLGNAANTDMGLGIFHSGDGTGQYVSMTNPAATRNSLGLLVNYSGTGGGTAGGGNAMEVQHYGTNGNAVDMFMGDPSLAPGPTNTTSEYATLSVTHMATGTSPTAGLVKTAISASNNSADPTILVNNNGVNDGDGINVFTTPVSGAPLASIYNQPSGIFSQANGTGVGIGVFGFGGDVGVLGYSSGGSGFAVYGYGNTGAAGAKSFHIDYPLDPENKTLSHYSVESDEILNMYRGMVKLDANGQAIIKLPNYFDTVNINPTYQLTAIGTATQPYVAKEINNNQFIVSGAPNTKVSWAVYAERNDPTIQYFSKKYNLKENVRTKRSFEVGRYITPEAYGQDKTKALWYDAEREKLYKERGVMTKQQKAMTPEKLIQVQNNVKESIEKRETEKKKKSPNKEPGEENIQKEK